MVVKLVLKVLVVLGVLTLSVHLAVAGPFGLSMGMKLSEFKGTLKEVKPHVYRTSDVPKKHSAFEYYILRFGPQSGLYYIKAVGSDISTNPYGQEVLDAFNAMEEKLKNIYGPNKRLDFLMKDSIWNEPRDWMKGLTKNERVLSALWRKADGATLKDDLHTVCLAVRGASRSTGFIVLEYLFLNQDACEAEIAAAEDDAL
jgi:hypothetical protein